jgi:predicted ABC-type ATPase
MSGIPDIKCSITISRVYGGNLQKEHLDHDAVLWFVVNHGNIPKLACYDNEYFIDYVDPILVYNIGKTKIFFWQPNSPKKDEKTGQVSENKFMIFTQGDGTIEGIQRFVQHCRIEYKNYRNNKLDNIPWYLEHCSHAWTQSKKAQGQEDYIRKNYIVFIKRPFVANKRFDNIFSEQAVKIRENVDFFKKNKTWYVEKGMPYNLGYVFHGPPGSGKTSCTKAIAKELERHVVNVRFGEISTNAQIDNLFNSNYVYVYDQENNDLEKIFIPITKRVIVVEDFDAMGDIILKRQPVHKKTNGVTAKKAKNEQKQDSVAKSDDLSNLDSLLNDDAKPEQKTPTSSVNEGGNVVGGNVAGGMSVTANTSWEDWIGEEKKKLAGKVKKGEKLDDPVAVDNLRQDEKDKKEDKINLSTLLNILDGPCEVEGRVICFTTNYIDKLDPALVRPGRITAVVEFELITSALVYDMFCYYYDNTKYQFKKEPFARVKDGKLSPAYVLQVITNNLKDPVKALTVLIEQSNKRNVKYY